MDPAVSGVAYPLVVEAGVRDIVWLRDLGPLVAALPIEVLTICLRPNTTVPTGPRLSVGTRYCGPLDARAGFKSSEGRHWPCSAPTARLPHSTGTPVTTPAPKSGRGAGFGASAESR